MRDLHDQAIAILLVSLRIAPMLAFSPPFTLMRVPAIVRVLLSIGLAASIVAANPAATWQRPFLDEGLILVAAGELFLGIALALAFQLAFAALLTAGRTIDIQAGFGLAVLVDPTTRSQMPLVGTIFAYAAGAIFFAVGGAQQLLALWSVSIARVPLGTAAIEGDPGLIAEYCSGVFLLALGLAGIVLLVLFLLDLTVAFLSRTLPQMNVLLLGFQVKAMATLLVLPVAIATSGAAFLQLLRYAMETAPKLAG